MNLAARSTARAGSWSSIQQARQGSPWKRSLHDDDLFGPLRDVVVALDVLERQPERSGARILDGRSVCGLERSHPDLRAPRADKPHAEVARARYRDPVDLVVVRAEGLCERRPPAPRVREPE